MNLITTRSTLFRTIYNFAKWSKPPPIPHKIKQQRRKKAEGDDKAAKLSKSQLENQAKRKKQQQDRIQQQSRLKIARIKVHDPKLELALSKQQLQRMHERQLTQILGIPPKRKRPVERVEQKQENPFWLPHQHYYIDQVSGKRKRKTPLYGNYQKVINEGLNFTPVKVEPTQSIRRMGVMGIKLGMTSLWDEWGRFIPITAIELDRCQVVQIRKPQGAGKYHHVQMGVGQRNLKRMSKPLIGHYLKNNIPPKRALAQFKVSEECLLPPGYIMGARHYTPGMYVDVMGVSVGHGFQGTIKRFGFRRQPASHGNSLTTRVLGSTGCRQDPGRVFKGKKMYGRMGGNKTIQRALRVFKIDCDKNILYLYGSVPGKAGSVIKIRDTTIFDKHEKNMELAHYPTFIEEDGKQYARQFIMFSGERDPDEIEYNDNSYILDDKEEEAAEPAATGSNAGLPDD